jgi:hypothetical protein
MYFKPGELCDESSHLGVNTLGEGEPIGMMGSGECEENDVGIRWYTYV